jgi:diguanylate cyclase (GGDEF)-like protein
MASRGDAPRGAVSGGIFSMTRAKRRRALCDPLTGLADRRLFESRVSHALLRARRRGYHVAVLILDMDEFATVNTALGRECGDALLRQVADRLQDLARDEDTVARFESDEFAILLEQVDDPTGAARAAHRILDTCREQYVVDSRRVTLDLSIGISVDEAGTASSESLIEEASVALARAKARGKRRFETFQPPIGVEASARLAMEQDLARALERDEIVVHYQPIVDLATGIVVSAEALARWAHPERGLLLPAAFIALAESGGMIVPLGRAVLEQACSATVGFRAAGAGEDFGVSVNISSHQLRVGDRLIADVRDALASSGLAPELLTLEITESNLLEDIDSAAEVVSRLRLMGIRVALDDFGTGYSSLTHLRHIPITGLKIDRSFVAGLDEATTTAIVRAIMSFSEELDITVVAEGAETMAQVAQLRRLGCRQIQGFYYSAAIPPAAFERLIRRGGSQAAGSSVTTLPRPVVAPTPPAAADSSSLSGQ